MGRVAVDAGFGLDERQGPLNALVAKRLDPQVRCSPVDLTAVWPAAHFGLHRTQAFAEAAPETRAAVVADCARGTLLEAYFIEKAGMAYAAKMTLLAQTCEERSLYALFAGEEAAHLHAVGGALGAVEPDSWQADPFLGLLGEVVEECDRATGQLVVQVALEGWGLLHYGGLRESCRDPGLQAVLDRIVADEAGHHGSGVQLLRGVALTAAQTRAAAALLGRMLEMVQAGPALVVGAVERHTGGLTEAQRRRLLAELDAEAHVRHRLDRLRSCLGKAPAAGPVVEALDAAGRFVTPTVEALA